MRDRWQSKTLFLFAAIGSAVGLGNVWRFPYLAYKFGGGAFLLPYCLALLVMGVPLLMMELMLGQKFQCGNVEAFSKIKRRFSGIGTAGILTSFYVVSYYAVVMAWMLIYFVRSFQADLPWVEAPKEYFFHNVLQISSDISHLGGINQMVLAALMITWIGIYFCVFKGVKSAEKVVAVTAPLPVILLFVLLLRGLTLDGAMTGIYYYILPDFSLLLRSEIWLAAASQIFFTLSLALGVMVAYASYNERDEDVKKNAWIIALVNSGISLVAGLVVFSVLGYMTKVTGLSIEEVAASGPGLAFVVFPKALSLLPFASVFSVLFFVMLLTLGLDSAFSLVESVNTAVKDHFPEISQKVISTWVCSVAFCFGLVFASRAGLYFLDLIDHFVVQYSIVFIGLSQCLAVAWGYGAEKMREEFNQNTKGQIGFFWVISMKYIIPSLLTILLMNQFSIELQANYENYPNWAIAFGASVAALPVALVFKSLLLPARVKRIPEGG